jgi:hypothetical protein
MVREIARSRLARWVDRISAQVSNASEFDHFDSTPEAWDNGVDSYKGHGRIETPRRRKLLFANLFLEPSASGLLLVRLDSQDKVAVAVQPIRQRLISTRHPGTWLEQAQEGVFREQETVRRQSELPDHSEPA